MRRKVIRGMDVVDGAKGWGMRACIVVRSDIVCWRLFSVISGEEREKYDGLHLLKAIAETNNIGRKYLNPQG